MWPGALLCTPDAQGPCLPALPPSQQGTQSINSLWTRSSEVGPGSAPSVPAVLLCSLVSHARVACPGPFGGRGNDQKGSQGSSETPKAWTWTPESHFSILQAAREQQTGSSFPNEGIFSSSSNGELEVGASSGSLADLGGGGRGLQESGCPREEPAVILQALFVVQEVLSHMTPHSTVTTILGSSIIWVL